MALERHGTLYAKNPRRVPDGCTGLLEAVRSQGWELLWSELTGECMYESRSLSTVPCETVRI